MAISPEARANEGAAKMPSPSLSRQTEPRACEETSQEDSEWAAPIARDLPQGAASAATTSSTNGEAFASSRSPQYKVDHIGRHMKSSKLRHAWVFFLSDAELKVELEHSRFSGKKKVLVDGKLLFSTTDKHLTWCWQHPESKAKISLHSENGRHSLRCEEPDTENGAAYASCDYEDSVLPEQPQSGMSGMSMSPCSVSQLRTPRCATPNDREEVAEVALDSPESVRRNLAPRYEEDDSEIAEEAKPSVPSQQRRTSLKEISSETARLNALLGVKDAQIAALQDELRRCALEREAAPAVEIVPDVPSRQAPEPAEHFLVAELPTPSAPSPRVPVRTPEPACAVRSVRSCSPGPLRSPPVRSTLDEEELDVTHRHGPVQQSVLALAAPATPAMNAPGTPCLVGRAVGRAVTPPRGAVRRYTATPRNVAVKVESVDTPEIRGRAGSMPPPRLVCASPPVPWPGHMEPQRASTPHCRSASVQPPRCWRSSTPGPRRMDVQVPGPGFQMAPPAAVRAAPGGDWRARPGPMMQPGVQPSMHPGMQPLPMQPGMPGMQPQSGMQPGVPGMQPQSGMQPGVPGMQPMPQVLLMPHARPLGPMVPVAMFGRPDARMMGQPWVQIGQ
ncbi:unnamed protein product [Effrenium voratum]|nr:unnamed protein product [Effrenium voratum]